MGSWLLQYIDDPAPADNTRVAPKGFRAPRPTRTVGPQTGVRQQPVTQRQLIDAGAVEDPNVLRRRGRKVHEALRLIPPYDIGAALGETTLDLLEGNKGAAAISAAAIPLALIPGSKGARAGFREVAPEAFHKALTTFSKARPSESGFITWRSPEEMRKEGMKVFLSRDGKTGYAIHPESGDIRNVFNHGAQGGGAQAVADALANRGGKVLDAFDTNLGNFYRDFGFKETWRSKWDDQYRPMNWDEARYGRPDVMGMEHPDAGRKTADQLIAQYNTNRAARKQAAGLDAMEIPTNIRGRPAAVADSVVSKAPAVIARSGEQWMPTPRGVFDRSAPKIQGQMASDPRLAVPAPKTDRMTTSPLVDAIVNSKTVRRGLEADAEKGALLGGPEWYELGPIKADLESRGGEGLLFSDFNFLGGGASASNSVPNELSAMSIANYARRHGVDRETAVKQFLEQTRSPVKAPLMDMHMNLGNKAIDAGVFLPSDPMSEAWKIPGYVNHRLGGGGLDVNAPGAMPALDTHERRRIMQFVMENPRLAKLARELGLDEVAAKQKGALPMRNALDYKAISELYTEGAQKAGLPTAGAFQASRWLGGGLNTGLKTQPSGDFLQILEDGLLYSAQQRGLDASPAGLRNYWSRVVKGDDFILPWGGQGPYPIR